MTQELIGEIACVLYLMLFLWYLWWIDKKAREGNEEVRENTRDENVGGSGK